MPWPAAVGSGLAFSTHLSGRSGPWQPNHAIAVTSGANVEQLGNASSQTRLAQTFTPSLTGKATTIRLNLRKVGTPTFTLEGGVYATSGGLPTGSALATAILAASSLTASTASYTFTLSAPVSLTSGTVYAFVLMKQGSDAVDASHYVEWARSSSDSYAGGAPYKYNSGTTTWSATGNGDLSFQTTIWSDSLYGVFADYTNLDIEVWKSTDAGETWTEMDSGASPAVSLGFDSYLSGSTIHIAYISGTAIDYCPFDCSTDTWGSTASVATAVTDASVSTPAVGVVATADTDVFVFYSGTYSNMGAKDAVYYKKSVGGAAFGSAVQFSPALANHYHFRGCAEGISNVVHGFLWQQGTGVIERHLTSADALSTVTSALATDAGNSYYMGPANKIVWALSNVVGGMLRQLVSGSSVERFVRVASADSTSAPTFTSSSIGSSSVQAASSVGSAMAKNFSTEAFWPPSAGTSIERATDSGGGGSFGNASVWSSSLSTVTKVDVQPIERAGGDVGVFYDNAAVLYFDGYPALSSGPGLPPAEINPRQSAIYRM